LQAAVKDRWRDERRALTSTNDVINHCPASAAAAAARQARTVQFTSRLNETHHSGSLALIHLKHLLFILTTALQT